MQGNVGNGFGGCGAIPAANGAETEHSARWCSVKRRPSRRAALRVEEMASARQARSVITDGKKEILANCPSFGGHPDDAIKLLDRICSDGYRDILNPTRARELATSLIGKAQLEVAIAQDLLDRADIRDAFERQQAIRRERVALARRRRLGPEASAESEPAEEPVAVTDAA